MANIVTLGLNVGQNQYDIVSVTGTGSPAQQVQVIINKDVVTEQSWAYLALEEIRNYIVSKGWPLP